MFVDFNDIYLKFLHDVNLVFCLYPCKVHIGSIITALVCVSCILICYYLIQLINLTANVLLMMRNRLRFAL